MHIHTCKRCGKKFSYCRACVFWPVYYKDKGYCSDVCYEQSLMQQQKEVVPTEDVEVVITDEDTSTSN